MKQQTLSYYNRNVSALIILPILICYTFFVATGCKKEFTATGVAASAGSENASHVADKPNIVLILADDVGFEVPTANGGESYSTPNIDNMARNGMRFTQCYSAPMCSPSRVMFVTGKYNFRNYAKWSVLDQSQRTFANLLGDVGYDTYVAGKWQFDGGDASVRIFGFNQSYTIFEQYANRLLIHDDNFKTTGSYKSPELYANGANLVAANVLNKYCDDILVDSLVTYAGRSAKNNKPFFMYYPVSLCHKPFSPTPDDPEYAAWDPNDRLSNATFFPSMVKYMDKKIGQLITKFDSIGVGDNTVYIFIGDNGCQREIYSRFHGELVQGGKMKSTVWGTHVPLIVYWRGVVAPGVNNDLIDFTDFLPTLAGIANTTVPPSYGTIDGVSFYPRLRGLAGTPRDWIFCHYHPEQHPPSPLKRWIQDTTYKLYDSTGYFYNTVLDPYEKKRLKDNLLTEDEKEKKIHFQLVMNGLH